MKKLRSDLKRLFIEWGKYYAIPAHWKSEAMDFVCRLTFRSGRIGIFR